MIYSGHQDALCESLALQRKLCALYPDYQPLIAAALNYTRGNYDDKAKKQMILEPTSLNIQRPKLPEAMMKGHVEKYLCDPRNTKNRQLFTLSTYHFCMLYTKIQY